MSNNNLINIIFGDKDFTAELNILYTFEGSATTISFETSQIIQRINNVGDVNGD